MPESPELDGLPGWRRNTWILAAGTFVAQIAFSMVVAFLPMYLVELGLRKDVSLWSGLTFAVSSLTYAGVAPVWGALSDRYGNRVMLLRSGLGIGLIYLLIGFATNHFQVFLLRALLGFMSGFIPAAIMLVATNTPDKELGPALGIVQTANAVGGITGPLVGGAAAELVGMRGTFFLSAGLLFVATMVVVFGVKERPPRRQAGSSSILADMRTILANPALQPLFVALFLAQAGALAIQPVLPLLVATLARQNVAFAAGAIFSLLGVSTALGAPLVSKATREGGALKVFQAGFVGACILSFLQGLARSLAMLGAFRFASGFANAAVTVAGNVLIAQAADREARGKAFGVLNSITSIGTVVGPSLGGLLGNKFGLPSAFYGGAAAFALAAAVMAASQRRPGKTGTLKEPTFN
ncbi:MAG: MFS transporter [Syntrophothermus sp.]